MRALAKTIVVVMVVPLVCGACAGVGGYPAAYVEKVDSTPDLMQTDPALGLVRGGQTSCCSVSVTNSLAWLAENGFEEVALWDSQGHVSYAETAQALEEALGLAARPGVMPPRLMRGLSRYLAQRGYTEADYELTYQGWYQPVDEGQRLPDLDGMRQGLVGDSAVWLLVGFYELDADGVGDVCRVISHHYVTLVGYGVDEQGNEDPDVLIVHDPAPRSGVGVSHDYVRVEPLAGGQLTVDPGSPYAEAYAQQLPIDATGYYRLDRGLSYNEQADVAILDGVIILRMKREQG